MTTLVTETSDPTLWGILVNKRDPGDGYIVHEGATYRAASLTDGTPAFIAYSTEELYDSRSVAGKPASYNKLDG